MDRAPRPTSGRQGRCAPVRVASVPAGHVYPRHVLGLGDDTVVHLPDPPSRVAGAWWPPAMLDPRWIAAHADDFDVMHVHFGFDALDPAELQEVVGALRRAGRPLVYTAHDLRNPHHRDPDAHDAHLDVLVPAADAVLTLTDGAAEEIEQRWGRRARVVPHPHVLPVAELGRLPDRDPDRFVIGLHLKSLRAGMDPLPVLRALVDVVHELDGTQLVVDAHRDVVEATHPRYDAAVAAALTDVADDPQAFVHVHDCYSDDELWAYLRSLDLSVLPYRFGTHSGWLEACHDLGTDVLAPDCGHLHTQRPCFVHHRDAAGLDVDSLQHAVRQAWKERPRHQATREQRLDERERVAQAHREVYAHVRGRAVGLAVGLAVGQ